MTMYQLDRALKALHNLIITEGGQEFLAQNLNPIKCTMHGMLILI